jgi:hypothetical protein
MCAGTLASMMGPSLKTLLMPAASNGSALERCHNSTDIYVSEGHPKIQIARGGSTFAGSTARRVNSSDPEVGCTCLKLDRSSTADCYSSSSSKLTMLGEAET